MCITTYHCAKIGLPKGSLHLRKVVKYTPVAFQNVEDVILNMLVVISKKIRRTLRVIGVFSFP